MDQTVPARERRTLGLAPVAASSLLGPRRLEAVAPDDVRAFKELCRPLQLVRGDPVFLQGTRHSSSYFIEQGLVRTYYTAPSGREVTLCYWSEGDLIGGPNLFGGGTHIWSSVAMRASRILAIRGEELQELSSTRPRFALWVAEVLMFKLKWVSMLFQLHGTESVSQRLPHLILMLCDIYGVREGGTIVIRHRLSQNDLATLVGTSRQWTNKILGELTDRELIRLERGQIVVLDEAGLAKLTGGSR